MLNLYCANEECRWNKRHKGGRFVFFAGKPYCEECANLHYTLNDCRNLWEFETTHLGGGKVQVKSLSHMRQLEKEHGVQSVAANWDSKNWDSPPQTRTELQYKNSF